MIKNDEDELIPTGIQLSRWRIYIDHQELNSPLQMITFLVLEMLVSELYIVSLILASPKSPFPSRTKRRLYLHAFFALMPLWRYPLVCTMLENLSKVYDVHIF